MVPKQPIPDSETPLTPVFEEVFPADAQCNYDALPSISSLPSLPSVQPLSPPSPVNSSLSSPENQTTPKPTSTSTPANTSKALPTNTSTNTRAQKKRKAPAIAVSKAKKRNVQRLNLAFQWRKTRFQHSAEISDPIFNEPIPSNWSAVDYFYRFFPKDLIEYITSNTNLYSTQETGMPIKVTKEEITDFLAINILMGIVSMPSYKDFWSNSFRYAKVADLMTLKRFQQIRRYVHFTDNSEADLSDRYYKIRPVIERVRTQCLSVEEENAFSIDEMIIPYKGKKAGSRRQYNPNKPCRWGFKNLVRAGVSGIIYDFMLYAGDDTFKDIEFEDEEENLGVGAKTVLALCKTIKNPASVVYFDNWFSSLELVYLLRQNYGLFSLGTIRKNRLKDANALLLSDKALKKKGRGAYCQATCNKQKVAIVKWHDNKPVTLVSSYVDAHPVETVKRFQKESNDRVNVPCPQIVKHYNRHMGGVDLADMLIALYRTGIKAHRWYLNIFSQILDIAINNGWLLRRRHYKVANIKKKDDRLKKFRYEVFAGLIKSNRENNTTTKDAVPDHKKIKKPTAERPMDSVRYDKLDHWPDHTPQHQRCKYCKKGQTNTQCTKCKVHLCYVVKRNCFMAFHKEQS